jgi:serine O-acetyltransferase
MIHFLNFLLTKVYKSNPIPEAFINKAFEKTVKDINFHFPNLSSNDIKKRIEDNANELAVFLFRLGNELYENKSNDLIPQIHWLLKELCSCEIYFNNKIDEGFYVVHGAGTVMGSRNVIGKGFKVHQGCTIGHRKNGMGNGSSIGNNVVMYANSSIIGELVIGSNVVIGGHIMVTENLQDNFVLTQRNKIQ